MIRQLEACVPVPHPLAIVYDGKDDDTLPVERRPRTGMSGGARWHTGPGAVVKLSGTLFSAGPGYLLGSLGIIILNRNRAPHRSCERPSTAQRHRWQVANSE